MTEEPRSQRGNLEDSQQQEDTPAQGPEGRVGRSSGTGTRAGVPEDAGNTMDLSPRSRSHKWDPSTTRDAARGRGKEKEKEKYPIASFLPPPVFLQSLLLASPATDQLRGVGLGDTGNGSLWEQPLPVMLERAGEWGGEDLRNAGHDHAANHIHFF